MCEAYMLSMTKCLEGSRHGQLPFKRINLYYIHNRFLSFSKDDSDAIWTIFQLANWDCILCGTGACGDVERNIPHMIEMEGIVLVFFIIQNHAYDNINCQVSKLVELQDMWNGHPHRPLTRSLGKIKCSHLQAIYLQLSLHKCT